MNETMARTITALRRNGFTVQPCATRQEALAWCLGLLRQAPSISRGGSVSCEELGLFEAIAAEGLPFQDYKLPEDRKRSLLVHTYVTSSNAVTEEGELVNIDGAGNRVAALSFGPERVLVVVGRNKLVPDRAAALERIRAVAAPRNTARLGKRTPCVKTGHCMDCTSPDRICRVLHVTMRPPEGRIVVVLVDEDLGY
ncbi:MAG: hypothetical protein A2284_16535 [Deltaproteobacteria bacterium RIFOXYA12_FULL_61_11]|nr:MAG: hypothetical protein A2284_16535 [Deltaproteobacteria bacterium RIFOXYA12_FULL_61_11]